MEEDFLYMLYPFTLHASASEVIATGAFLTYCRKYMASINNFALY